MSKKFIMKNNPSFLLSKQQLRPLTAALLLAFSPFVTQAATPVVPGAGNILQQAQPPIPAAPLGEGPGVSIVTKPGPAEKGDTSFPFFVKRIEILGNTLFDTATLHALVAGTEGKDFTLNALNDRVSLIAKYYHEHGYSLAQAVLPQQTIKDGVVRVQIIEARYGKIKLINTSRVNDSLLHSTLTPLQAGEIIGDKALDHPLLLLSDISGVNINATLAPGESEGTSDLLINATPGPMTISNLVVDNYGNRYTGRERIGGTVNVLNPLRHGDVLSANLLSSGKGMNYGRLSYEGLVNGNGTRIGASYSALRYVLGQAFEALNAHGTARVASLWVKHSFLRERNANFYGQLQYDQLELRDHIDASAIMTDRHLDNWTASFTGDVRDLTASNSLSTWSTSLTAGEVHFDNAAAHISDLVTARTDGGFSKLNLNLSHMQALPLKNTSLYLSFAGQISDSNLDSSEKMSAGGTYTVRSYDMGAVSADSGYIASAELRHELGQIMSGQYQSVAFIDNAHVTVNKATWATGANTATLSGLGAGLNWAGPQQWNAKAYVAKRIGSTPVLVASTPSVRGWIELSKGF